MISLIADDLHLDRFLNYFYPPPNRKLLQVFTTYEYKKVEQDKLPRNSWLHFDPYASLKFAVMLQDTTARNGSLFAIPTSHAEGKTIRENFMQHKEAFKKGFSHRFVDYQEIYNTKYTEKDAIHINTKVGDLLILNTDNWHAGGVIQEDDAERMAIYYHNRQQ
jgi:ectoine hydroxylase-related dioxygenase (phytanoyl-CoA dioxygenase family)